MIAFTTLRRFLRTVAGVFALNVFIATTCATDLSNAKKMFDTQCAACHNGALPEAPKVEALRLYPPERIVEALESGVMSTVGLPLSKSEKEAIAFYITGEQVAEKISSISTYTCDSIGVDKRAISLNGWNGWGGKLTNQRHQADHNTVNLDTIGRLKLKWAFAFPDATRVRAQPVVTQSHIFIGSQEGIIYALDNATGCVDWQYQADSEVRGALFLTNKQLVFGDFKANAYGLNPETGGLLWKTKVYDHPMATITGSVIADDKKMYVPVSSSEVIPAARGDYPCCSFRGAIVAIELETGNISWTSYTTSKPVPTEKNRDGTQQYGPSGAPIWSGPTLDLKRNRLYATTGQNYSSPATETSDAVIAFNLEDGKIEWVSQVTKNDAWNGGCVRKTANCPKENGPDFDIGASAILSQLENGKQLLIVGQKSGMTYAMDPDANGKVVWRQRVGSGGTMGGVHWGMSTDNHTAYVGVSDLPTNNPYKVGKPQPGLHALDLATGHFKWRTTLPSICDDKPKFLCFGGISAAVSSSSDLVYAGSLDGVFRVFSAARGKILWEFNTKQVVKTVNGVDGFGGAIEADGPVLANGNVYLTSGYDKWGEAPGNVLMVFSIDGK